MASDEDRLRLLRLKRERMALAAEQQPAIASAGLVVPKGAMQTGQILPQEQNQQVPQTPQGLSLGNVLEPAVAIAAGIPTEIGAGLAGIASIPFVGSEAGDVVHGVRKATSLPLSSEGRQGMEAFGEFVRPGIDVLTGAEDWLAEEGFKVAGPTGAAVGKTLPTALLMVTGPLLSKTGKVLEKSGITKAKTKHNSMVEDLITPDKTKRIKEAEVARTVEHGRFFKKSTVELSAREKVLAHQVGKVPGVSKKESLQGNYNLINAHNNKLGKKLDAKVVGADVQIPHIVANIDIDDAVVQLLKDNPFIPVDKGGLNEGIARFAAQAKEILAKNPQTAKGLLDARKEFDQFAKKQRANVFDTPQDPIVKLSTFAIRDAMNARIARTIPKFKRELAEQSALFESLANIAPKAAKQGNTVMERVWERGAEFLGFRNKIMQTLAVAAGTSVLGAATTFAPTISLTMGAGGVLYLGGKALSAARSRMAIGKMIALSGQVIGTTKNKKVILQMKADRAALLQMLKNIQEEE